MKATVVVDNIGTDSLKGEWGLCIYIEYENKTILLDSGASGLFVKNCNEIGLPLDKVDYAVLSHAHYDHADGMKFFFNENKNAKKWIFSKYIGIPKGILTDYKDRIELVSGDYSLCEGVYLIPHKTPGLDEIGKRENMYAKIGRTYIADDFSHEQSLVFDTSKGLVIFNSCSHGGAVNIINEISSTFPDKKVYALIGGFHLFNKSESFVRDVAKKIKETGIKMVYTGHCTGKKSYDIMKEELGESLHQLKVNLVMEF